MKILSVGDIHGKSIWEKIDTKKYDEIIFIGDLYDAFEYTNNGIHNNALALIQWAHEAGNVKFIIGNHDAHYFKWHTPVFKQIRGSGYSANQLYRAYNLYIKNKELFKIAYEKKNYLWTHAGLSNSSYNKHINPSENAIRDTFNFKTLAEVLNYMWDINHLGLFRVPLSRRGNDTYGSLLWADRSDTIEDPLSGYHQIVGHTSCEDIIHKDLNDKTSITYIDCLNKQIGKFYEIDI